MKNVNDIRAEIAELSDTVDAILDVAQSDNRDLTADEQTQIDEIQGVGDDGGKLAKLETEFARLEKIENRRKTIAAQRVGSDITRPGVETAEPGVVDYSRIRVPARARARGQLKSFNGSTAEQESYVAGLFYAAALFGNDSALDKLGELGVVQNAQLTNDNTSGGYLVPEDLEASIIRLVESFGVARRYCQVWPVSGGSISIPKRAGGYTAYYVGENATGTQSDLSFSQVKLDPKKLMVLSRWSTELPEDAAVQLGDLITREIALAFANAEDQALFNGDGTSTYGGIQGLAGGVGAGSTVTTASNVDTFAEITISTFEEAVGLLPMYEGIRPAWFVHNSCWANVMQRLAMAAGGNTTQNYESGLGRSFLGYPVVISQVLQSGTPSTDISGNHFGYFGDIGMGVAFGDKRGMSIATDSSIYFESDAIALRGTERYDINCHDVGDASSAGAVVALAANAS